MITQGNSLSESSEDSSEGEGRGGQYVCDFRIQGTLQAHLAGRLLLFIQEQTSELMVLVLFQVWEGAGNWVHKIFTQPNGPWHQFCQFPQRSKFLTLIFT